MQFIEVSPTHRPISLCIIEAHVMHSPVVIALKMLRASELEWLPMLAYHVVQFQGDDRSGTVPNMHASYYGGRTFATAQTPCMCRMAIRTEDFHS